MYLSNSKFFYSILFYFKSYMPPLLLKLYLSLMRLGMLYFSERRSLLPTDNLLNGFDNLLTIECLYFASVGVLAI